MLKVSFSFFFICFYCRIWLNFLRQEPIKKFGFFWFLPFSFNLTLLGTFLTHSLQLPISFFSGGYSIDMPWLQRAICLYSGWSRVLQVQGMGEPASSMRWLPKAEEGPATRWRRLRWWWPQLRRWSLWLIQTPWRHGRWCRRKCLLWVFILLHFFPSLFLWYDSTSRIK